MDSRSKSFDSVSRAMCCEVMLCWYVTLGKKNILLDGFLPPTAIFYTTHVLNVRSLTFFKVLPACIEFICPTDVESDRQCLQV